MRTMFLCEPMWFIHVFPRPKKISKPRSLNFFFLFILLLFFCFPCVKIRYGFQPFKCMTLNFYFYQFLKSCCIIHHFSSSSFIIGIIEIHRFLNKEIPTKFSDAQLVAVVTTFGVRHFGEHMYHLAPQGSPMGCL